MCLGLATGYIKTCNTCKHLNKNKQNEKGECRCTKFLMYVNRNEKGCKEYEQN